ncbi:MAG TPA: hypothetical protein VGZ73_08215, partial [Bryobacteraceae bacterium]|nr:hypothetical protein [Bryobacteraceae bacterium]
TKGEYEAKKAAIEHTGAALAALDNALSAGVLTKDEYQAKRAALLASSIPAASSAGPTAVFAAAPPPPASSPATAGPDTPNLATAPATQTPRATPVTQPPSAAPAAKAPSAAAEAQPSPPAAMAPQPSSTARGNYLVMKKVTVMDQNGFERPIPSASLLLPADWQYQGATQWNIKDSCNGIQTSFRSSGPDGRAFEIFPLYNWAWADDPTFLRQAAQQKAQYGTKPCDVMPPMGAAEFLRRNLPRLRPNAQLAGMEPLPKYLQLMQQQARQTEQMATRYNLRQQVRPDVARARLRYNLNGKAVEEWVVATTVITGTLGPSYDVRSARMTQAFNYSCTATLSAARAPEGQLDSSEKFFELIISTIRIDPSWQSRINQQASTMQAIEQKGIRDRVAINTKTANEIADIRRQGYENQQRSEDHIFGQFSDNTRGVERFRNPTSGETFELSNLYGHAWVNNRNEVFLSDQEGVDPNVVLKGNWTALEPVKR